MSVSVGSVKTIPAFEKADKAQAVKVLEEAAEVFAAWQVYENTYEGAGSASDKWVLSDLVDECADLITATCDLLAGLGVDDMSPAMRRCERRNEARGRIGS